MAKPLDVDEYEAACVELEEVIDGMTEEEEQYHRIKTGLHFKFILDDYRWNMSFTGMSVQQVNAIKEAEVSADNIEMRIPMWINTWDHFSFPKTSAREKKQFAEESANMICDVATYLPDHPANGRIMDWLVIIYDRDQRTFSYDA